MPAQFTCDFCEHTQPIDAGYIGKLVTCPRCGQNSRVAPVATPAAETVKPLQPMQSATVPISQQTTNRFAAAAMAAEEERRDSLVLMGRMMFYLGFAVVLAYSFVFDTSVRRVGDPVHEAQTYNIGLLNQQLSGVIVGAMLVASGAAMLGLSGRPIVLRDRIGLCVLLALYVLCAFADFKLNAVLR